MRRKKTRWEKKSEARHESKEFTVVGKKRRYTQRQMSNVKKKSNAMTSAGNKT